jgi:cyanophycin synthetase
MPVSDIPSVPAGSRPMRLVEHSVYRGPNRYSRLPMIRLRLDLGDLQDCPTDRLDGFADALVARLPGLADHGCSYGEPGGFLRRVAEGTWLGHVIEHVAIALQVMAGSPVTRGKTRSVRDRPGWYDICYAWREEAVGLAAGAAAARIVAALLPAPWHRVARIDRLGAPLVEDPADIRRLTEALIRLRARVGLGPSTQALSDAAARRGIPVTRLDRQSLLLLGHGRHQQYLRASITGRTPLIAVELAGDKDRCRERLADAGLPVPRGMRVRDGDAAWAFARDLGRPVVVKPLDGNHGRGVSIGIASEGEVREAHVRARGHGRGVVVEEQLIGADHRILVVDGRVVAVAERRPAQIVGDGYHDIATLIAILNEDPRRGAGHQAVLTRIRIDAALEARLAARGRTLGSVPAPGETVVLGATANLSAGGTATDRTAIIHPDNARVAREAALVLGLDVAGIDFLSPDIARPVAETGGGIVEVNAAPGLRMHLAPSEGRGREVARPIIASLFPRGAPARVPIVAITGTNGKSTTVRMLGAILRAAGRRTGMTTTSGVYLNDRLLWSGDASGPRSAGRLLRHPSLDAAVLETARGGIVREGLGFEHCDVGAVLNVSEDHLGIRGIDSLADLAAIKAVVVRNVARRGASVLNLDDPLTRRMARLARGRLIWFSMKGGRRLDAHVADGGQAALLRDGALMLNRSGGWTVLMPAAEVPATLGGAARFNTANALAAAAMAMALGLDDTAIRAGLAGFVSDYAANPGRLNLIERDGVRILIDYAHNPASLAALGDLLGKLRGEGRLIGMVSIPGDRRDEDMRAMGRLAAGIFDRIVFREAPDGRGRSPGAVMALLAEGALGAGAGPDRIRCIWGEAQAAAACLADARPGDLVVLLPTDVEGAWRQADGFSRATATRPQPEAAHG